ncbi:unnamed protein product [Symbiodinium sp. CCMP2456]|nr:unnamed protein product [Symbiodinium sp. CCMP2456]
MKDSERQRSIHLMPLKTAVLFLLASGCWFVLAIGWNMFSAVIRPSDLGSALSAERWSQALILSGLMLLLSGALLPFVFYLGMVLVADLDQIPRQLANFRLVDAECFCCSNNHRHPHNGSRLQCDRKLVYKTLKQWYDDVESEADHLETFSRLVREELAPSITLLISGATLPLSYTIFTVGASNLPYLADHIALWIANVRLGSSGYALAPFTLRQVADWGTVPLASMLAVWISNPLLKAGLRLRSRWCAAILTQSIVVFVVVMVWAPTQVALGLTEQGDLRPVALFLFWLAVLLALHSPLGKKGLAWALGEKPRTMAAKGKEDSAMDDIVQEKIVAAGKGREVAAQDSLAVQVCPSSDSTFYL